MQDSYIQHPSSFRDPSGFIFTHNNLVYRQVNTVFKEDFDHFIKSGCYDHLRQKGLLISHEIIHENLTGSKDCYLTLKPFPVNFISYPEEWPFDLLKDAALLTLQLARESISYGMILKDATPYNIQWQNGKLIFIDTLSFEHYDEKKPWIAYRQFCEMFLSPLLLMYYAKKSLHELFLAYPEGIPLPITQSLLPLRSRFSLHTFLHIHLQANLSQRNKNAKNKEFIYSKQKLQNLLSSLEGLVHKLTLTNQQSVWGNYYKTTADRGDYLENKKTIINKWLDNLPEVKKAIDLGANTGEFSKLLANKDMEVISADTDAVCINSLYRDIKKSGVKNIQPLIINLANPTPATGFTNEERPSFINRTKADLILALALVHHLAIGKNIPFKMIASLFSVLGENLMIEFVPILDTHVQLMLEQRENIFDWYDEEHFESAFGNYFNILQKETIKGSGRSLYLMNKK
jgi:2-polyprenyl-3-methyl-5-hydroxy-6-metoxy-1,4-benzoquinol methylase